MTLALAARRIRRGFPVCVSIALALLLRPHTARAWAIGSQINETGCHEPITASALRAVRARFDTAPVVAPSRDEAAMIADVVFAPPRDLVHDLAGMTLLLAVRDNDLKGIDPLASLDLIQVHGNPETQDEHCIRSPSDDDAAGNASALAACRAFIARTAAEALDGLDDSGRVDATRRVPLKLYVATRGAIEPRLPLFYLKIGAAMHALEDGFPHTYRTPDGAKVTVVLNWIDLVGDSYDEARDGPPHRAELDRCWDAGDPTIHRNYELATEAATALLGVALDPALTREQKIRQFDAVTAAYLGYQPGCTFDNDWCDPPEAAVTNSLTCSAPGDAGLGCAAIALAVVVVRRRRRGGWASAALVVCALVASARAQAPPPAPPPTRPAPSPDEPAQPTQPAPGTGQPAPPGPVAPSPPPPAPVTSTGREPGRDVKTPTPQETAEVRAAKQLGSPLGFAASIGGSLDRAALASALGVRYRIREQWLIGLDAGWNPWITTSPMRVRAGVATVAATLIRRFPMRFDRVNLRSSLHLGISTLLFDVYGAPSYSTGPYGAISLLGLDYDLGGAVRIVCDPMEIALPVPLVGQLPLYYEQFRFMIGVQVGS